MNVLVDVEPDPLAPLDSPQHPQPDVEHSRGLSLMMAPKGDAGGGGRLDSGITFRLFPCYIEYMTPDMMMFQVQLRRDGVQLTQAQNRLCAAIFAVAADEPLVAALLTQAWPGSMVRMTEALANGVALGWNPRKTERAMREAGRSVLQRALLIARTEQLRAYRTASLANYRASGVLSGYRRLAAKSARTCLACLLADGEFYTLDVAFEEHPAGRCTMVPVLASGEAPAWETGRDWFGRQPEATQRRVMGPAAFEAWRAGAVRLDDLVERHEHPVWGGALVVRSLKKAIGEGEAK